MTIAELYRWAIERAWGEKKINQLQAMIQGYVVLPSDCVGNGPRLIPLRANQCQ
jgi:hypothetical protein